MHLCVMWRINWPNQALQTDRGPCSDSETPSSARRNVSTSLRLFFCKSTNNLGAPLFSVNDCPGFQSGFTRIGPSGGPASRGMCQDLWDQFFERYRDPWRPPFLLKDWQGFLSGFAKINPSGVSRETDGPTLAFHFPMGTILIRTRSRNFGYKSLSGSLTGYWSWFAPCRDESRGAPV